MLLHVSTHVYGNQKSLSGTGVIVWNLVRLSFEPRCLTGLELVKWPRQSVIPSGSAVSAGPSAKVRRLYSHAQPFAVGLGIKLSLPTCQSIALLTELPPARACGLWKMTILRLSIAVNLFALLKAQ